MLLPVLTYGQEGVIVDAESKEALPYVSLYVSPTCGTVSNNDGEFSLKCEPEDEVRITCIGYRTQRYKASALPTTIKMHPISKTLKEVTVNTADNLIPRLVTKMQKEAKKKRKETGQYFFRLTTQYPGTDELAEAFLTAKSCVQMRDITFHSGRRGQLKDKDVKHTDLTGLGQTNLHLFLRLAPVLVNFDVWNGTYVPADIVLDRVRNLYFVSSTTLTEDDGTEICKIDFTHNPKVKSNIILDGTMYVDRKKCQLLRFDGILHNLGLRTYNQTRQQYNYTIVEYTMHVDYRHDHGFTEIASMSGSLIKDSVKVRHLLFNLGDKKMQFSKSMRVGNNMLECIDKLGCDSTLWYTSDIVKRTKAEERIAFGMETEEYIPQQQRQEKKDTILESAMRKLMEGTMPLTRPSAPKRSKKLHITDFNLSFPGEH